ncbi:PAS-domain containing protein [Magnetospirillum sp. SS-4]|uniref:PAS-domain containing protein n=1 Tax=Magnetospirillum sp. SS-4 TaxID=2681465 RepID=UPI0013835F23|nr:PAS-domain containing protein [Magnetospirillum sp. SS-4]CAA7612987.1 Diguanylate cyclase/phosphodiesterase with PAS/PAC sensor(S) (modular protein) [Magnetospirillum sp. SS-4]
MHHGAGAGSTDDDWRHLIEAVEEFGQGFTVFDRDLRLVLCNRRFLELLDFPADFSRRGTDFATFMRYNVDRGEYGPGDGAALVAERVAQARRFEPHCFERTRPGGVVIQVRGAPLPSGGFVTIYADVTGQRQAEEALQRRTEYLRSVIDNLPQGISVFDENLRLKFWNANLLDVLGLPEESVYPDVPFDDLIMIPALRGEYGPGDPAAHVRARRELAMQFLPHRFERSRPTGRAHLVEGRPMRLGDSLIGFVTTYTDITDRISIEHEVRRKNDVLQTVFDNIPGGISLFDKDLRLVAYNAEFKRLLDFPDELFEDGGTTMADLFRFNARRGEYGTVDVEEHVKGMLERASLRLPHKFERARPNGLVLEIRGMPLPDGGFVSIYTDVTERKAAEEEINRLARFDSLTGLANRHSLESRLEQSLADSRRHETRLAVLFLDLDRFKSVNDTLGHAVGDELLIEVSRRLQSCVRESDIVARLGGDEFVVVVSDFGDPADVVVILDKIIAQVGAPVVVGPHRLTTSTSIGIGVFPDDGGDRATLMKNADVAMYHAKTAGRGRYRFFDETMNTSVRRRLDFETALRGALDRDEFVLHYQPQMDLGTGAVVGVEALIRWNRPGEGLMLPAAFISMADELDLMDPIGAWVMTRAMRTLAHWQSVTGGPIRLAINVGASQIRPRTLAGLVRAGLAASALAPGLLTLEVAEQAAMADPEAVLAVMAEIRSMGVALAMDDFGTGPTSLRHLKQFPLSYLKLDRSLTADMDGGPGAAALCAAATALAHSLGWTVIAEGVETPIQLDCLRRMACDGAQGYHLSHPLPESAALSFILDRSGLSAAPASR